MEPLTKVDVTLDQFDLAHLDPLLSKAITEAIIAGDRHKAHDLRTLQKEIRTEFTEVFCEQNQNSKSE
jgi:hypothetical protein